MAIDFILDPVGTLQKAGKALQSIADVITGNEPASAPTLDDIRVSDGIRADRWKIFDWADQEDPEETPKIVSPPQTIYKPININIPSAPEIPDRRLPAEEDGQTSTKTVGASISVKNSLKEKEFGKLLWNPIRKGKQKLRLAYDPDLAKKLEKDIKNATQNFNTWYQAQIDPEQWIDEDYTQKFKPKLVSGSALLRPTELKGFQGGLRLVFGNEWIETLAFSYHSASLNAFQSIRDSIAEKTEIKQFKISRKTSTDNIDPKIELLSDAGAFYRSGFHRYPAVLPEFLIRQKEKEDDEKTVIISDHVSMQEWLIKNLDALFGEFPVKLKYKTLEGQEETLEVDNISEALAELLGLSLNIAMDADTSVVLGLKNLVEATKACNAAIVAGDYARANADYLGYGGKEIKRKVRLTYTPGKEDIYEFMKPSESNTIGFEMAQKDSLQEVLKQLIENTTIARAAVWKKWGSTLQPPPGEAIKKQRKEQEDENDKQWQDLINSLNNPTGVKKIDGNPIPKIKDINTGDKPDA